MNETSITQWPEDWIDPSQQRSSKPRHQGLTMVIDKGLGHNAFHDLLETGGPYIDICKLGFGTSALYTPSQLQKKITEAIRHQLYIMPGGTFFEVASQFDSMSGYLQVIQKLGFNAVEISDGTFPIPASKRDEAIRIACDMGLMVCTEYGKKASSFVAELDELIQTVESDIRSGATFVIIEARESGNVGVFNKQGDCDLSFISEVIQAVGPYASRLIWEAPQKEQQVTLLESVGYQVNLGNIAPTDVFSVEALRRGLRADTSSTVIERRLRSCESK